MSIYNFNLQPTFLLICSGEVWEADELFLIPLLVYLMHIQTSCLPQWTMMHVPTNHNDAPLIIQLLNPSLFPQSTTDPLGDLHLLCRAICSPLRLMPRYPSDHGIYFHWTFLSTESRRVKKNDSVIHSSSFFRLGQYKGEMKSSN